MAESTLTRTFPDLQKAVSIFLGYGSTIADLDADQLFQVNDSILSGLSNFYFPVLPGDPPRHHEFSFLKPTRSITTVADKGDYDLPDDYGGIEGDITFEPFEGHGPIEVVPEATIRKLRHNPDATGFPARAAIRPKILNQRQVDTITLTGTSGTSTLTINGLPFVATFNTDLSTTVTDFIASFQASLASSNIAVTGSGASIILTATSVDTEISTQISNTTGDLDGTVAETIDGTVGQRFEMLLYPKPSAANILSFQMNILPEKLTGANPQIYGGAAHSETVLESCLAVAEERYDDTLNGLHKSKFVEKLFASVSLDSKMNRPENLGNNRDLSDFGRNERRSRVRSVTVNGIFYQG